MLQCPNCSTGLAGEYCFQCGQQRITAEDFATRRFVREMADVVTDLRHKSKTLRTIRSLLIPGLLTAEYMAGRRHRYLHPLKLYLVCASLFFLSAPIAGLRLSSMLHADRTGTLGRLISARAADRDLNPALFDTRFDSRVQTVYTITLSAVAVAAALVLPLLFRKRRRPYAGHLIFALHYVAFVYLLAIATGISRTMGLSLDAAEAAGYGLLTPYVVLALKRLYPEPLISMLSKAGALVLATFTLTKLASLAAIRITLLLV